MMRWKLGAKFSLFLVLIFLMGSGVEIFILSQHFNRQAERAIKERAELVLTTMQAVRNYTQTNIQPRLEDSADGSNAFIPESVPNFAARTVFSDFRQQAPDFKAFSYKEAALNPTNPEDRTDEFELGIFKQLQEQQTPELLSGYRSLEGKKLFYLARPLVMDDVKCLSCHGRPSNAPQNLIEMYGTQNGFGWKLDQVVAAQMVYVPADQILERGRQSLMAVINILLSLFGVLFLAINLLLWCTVIQPLKILTRVAKQMSSCSIDGQQSLPDQSQGLDTLTGRKDEPGQLARAFQFMVHVLSQREQDLQLAVEERTLWLEQEMRERQTAQASLQTYAHAINHDLRNLAMGISSVVQGILFQTVRHETAQKNNPPDMPDVIDIEPAALTMIQKSCDRQLNLMNSLMAKESADIWQTELKLETVNLAQLAKELQTIYRPRLIRSTSTLNTFIAADIPNIQADLSQLQRVFENLIDNALKYNPEGVDIKLNAVVDDDQSNIHCTVIDNGMGIDADQDQDLFGIYARGHFRSQVPGHGLGLYICRKIVEAHGGMMGVIEPICGGAAFWFTLPLHSSAM